MPWHRRRRTAVLFGSLAALVGCSQSAVVPTAPPEDPPLITRAPLPNWTPAKPGTFTLVATGDVLVHPGLTAQAEADAGAAGGRDFRPMLAGVRDIVQAADVAVCHLEVPLGRPGGPFSGFPAFNAPPEVAAALADTGYDVCSTASNHALDQGPDGVRSTLDALDAAGIGHIGSARGAQEAARPHVIDLDGVRVGHVSFTFGLTAGRGRPADQPWLVNLLDVDAVLAAARAARAAGADVVVASLHWGAEYESRPTEQQQAIARQLLADPAVDLIIGHHSNVVQPFERIDGKWVAYGLGNHLARHAEPRGTTEEGVIARFRFGRDKDGRWSVVRADYVPTLIELGPPIRLRNAATLPDGEPRETALRRIGEVVRSRDSQLFASG